MALLSLRLERLPLHPWRLRWRQLQSSVRRHFQQTSERLEALSREVTQISSPVEHAAFLLLKGLDAAMRGELAAAQTSMETLSRFAEERLDMRWQLRCWHFRFFVLCLQRFPPVLRFWPNDDNNSAVRNHARLAIVQQTKDLIERRRSFASLGWSALDKLESDLICDTKAFMNNLWMLAYRNHPEYPNDPFTDMMKSLGIDLFATSEPYPEELPALTNRLRLPVISRYLDRLKVEYRQGAGLEDALPMLRRLFDACREQGDWIGAASCLVIQADRILSPPFSNPVSFNLMPLDQELGWDYPFWDAAEAQHPLGKNPMAEDLYVQALDLYRKGRCKRGQAAVKLRQGCIGHVEALIKARAGLTTEAAALNECVRENVAEAEKLFRMDSTNLYLTATHRLLVDISTDDPTNVIETACEIGAWGKDRTMSSSLSISGSSYCALDGCYTTCAEPVLPSRGNRSCAVPRLGPAFAAWTIHYSSFMHLSLMHFCITVLAMLCLPEHTPWRVGTFCRERGSTWISYLSSYRTIQSEGFSKRCISIAMQTLIGRTR